MMSTEFLSNQEKLKGCFLEEVALNIAFSLRNEGVEAEGWKYRAVGVVSLMRDLFYHRDPICYFHGVPLTEEMKNDLLLANWPAWFDKKLIG